MTLESGFVCRRAQRCGQLKHVEFSKKLFPFDAIDEQSSVDTKQVPSCLNFTQPSMVVHLVILSSRTVFDQVLLCPFLTFLPIVPVVVKTSSYPTHIPARKAEISLIGMMKSLLNLVPYLPWPSNQTLYELNPKSILALLLQRLIPIVLLKQVIEAMYVSVAYGRPVKTIFLTFV